MTLHWKVKPEVKKNANFKFSFYQELPAGGLESDIIVRPC